mmetsp:Transcript_19756/g.32210  ORF Transcript_19756/g.32210 Transcript_19756/m.32210 type:complete len:465 (-) Transcript_19756:140-1534(-)
MPLHGIRLQRQRHGSQKLFAWTAATLLMGRLAADVAWAQSSLRPAQSASRRTLRSLAPGIEVDPRMEEKLKAAQERVSRAKLAVQHLRSELCDRNFLSPEIDRTLLTEVFRIFAPESAKPMREPILQRELLSVLPDMQKDTEALAALITTMAIARLPHEPAWQKMADTIAEACSLASARQLVAFAWSFATAGEPRQDLWQALKTAMASKHNELSADERTTFAWSCAEVGNATELFGEASEVASAKASTRMLEAIRKLDGEQLYDSPPIVLVPNVITAQQSQELIQMADDANIWWQSSRRGARTAGGEDALRTSSSAVLGAQRMMQQPAVKAVRAWTSKALNVPEDTVEALQIVRYRKGEQYSAHVDWGRKQDASLWLGGQRTATALIYLNTLPEDCGGETSFERLGIKVSPHAGSALVWSNVDRDGQPQDLVEHRAMPVLCETEKYAVNVWVREKSLPRFQGAE